jgi:hypothetical protein
MTKFVLLSLFLIISCNKTKKQVVEIEHTKVKQELFKLPKSEFTILTYQSNWHWVYQNVASTKLSELELIDIEYILKNAIDTNNKLQEKELNAENICNIERPFLETSYKLNLDQYKRQYVPIINSKGEKEVWINFFCNDLHENYFGDLDWKTDLIQVEDGGNCFFNIKINLTTKTYYQLEINYNA